MTETHHSDTHGVIKVVRSGDPENDEGQIKWGQVLILTDCGGNVFRDDPQIIAQELSRYGINP